MYDPSEFDSADEHIPEDIDSGDVLEDEVWDFDNVLIMDTTETHVGFWEDFSDVNPDDIPF